MPLEQSADLFFFLPKFGMADPLTASLKKFNLSWTFPIERLGERFLKRSYELLHFLSIWGLADVKAWFSHSLCVVDSLCL